MKKLNIDGTDRCHQKWILDGIPFKCERKYGHEGHHSTIKPFTWWD